MLRALKAIYNVLGDKLNDSNWVINFGEYLVHKPTFLYYDMENRTNGEETFVVINTTGEPLSATQNLKPKVMTAKINKDSKILTANGQEKTIASAWEDIENYFWNKAKIENGNDTGDAGFKEFLRWVVILHNVNKQDTDTVSKILAEGKYSFDVEEIDFKEIFEYWEVVKAIFDSDKDNFLSLDFLSPKEEEIQKGKDKVRALKQIDCFKLLPLIEYCKNRKRNLNDRNTIRFYNFVLNLSRLDNVSRGINTLVHHVVKMAIKCNDVIELLNTEWNKTLMTEEEKEKLSLLQACSNEEEKRQKMENAFWELQGDRILDGEILNVIKWATVNDVFSFEKFKMYKNIYTSVFSQNGNLNLLRRALLTIDLIDFPFDNGKSFCDIPKEWKTLIDCNTDKIKTLLDKMKDNVPHEYLNSLCDSYSNKDNPYYDFIHYDYLLDYCDHHHVNYWCGKMMLCKRWWAQPFSINNAHLLYRLGATWQNNAYDNAKKYECTKLCDSKWSIWYCVSNNCVVCENKVDNIAIDSTIEDNAIIRVFYRNPEIEKEANLNNLKDLGFTEIEGSFKIEMENNIENVNNLLEKVMVKIEMLRGVDGKDV